MRNTSKRFSLLGTNLYGKIRKQCGKIGSTSMLSRVTVSHHSFRIFFSRARWIEFMWCANMYDLLASTWIWNVADRILWNWNEICTDAKIRDSHTHSKPSYRVVVIRVYASVSKKCMRKHEICLTVRTVRFVRHTVKSNKLWFRFFAHFSLFVETFNPKL